VALLTLLPTGFAGTAVIRTVALHPHSLLRFLPPLWYLGLYQTLQHRATPWLTQLGRTGLWAILVVFGLMAVTYALSYRKRFAGVLEGGRRPSEQRLFALVLAVLGLFSKRAPGFQRAAHRFAIRALLRNETHRLAIAVSLGLGWLLASQYAASVLPAVVERGSTLPAIPLLEAPLVAAYLLILGLRIAIDLPAGVSANWIFRAALDSRENEALPVARRVMLGFLVPVVVVPDLIFSCWAWGLATAVFHILYLLAISISLIEVQLAGYRKVPLTCPMPGFRDNLLMLCLVQFLGFQLFTRAGAAMEYWMLDMPLKFLLVPAAMCGVWYWNRQRIAEAREAGELEEGVIFENAPVRAVERLNLSDGM